MSEKSKIFDSISLDVLKELGDETACASDDKSPFDEFDDSDECKIFGEVKVQNTDFIDDIQQDKVDVVKDIIQPVDETVIVEIAQEEETKQDEKVKDDIKAQNENEAQINDNKKNPDNKNSEQKYGKFKNPEELLHAYMELEKEFTRRSQKLKELENAKSEPFANEAEWHEAVDKFFSETPSAKPFAKDIANEILSHPELKKDKNCLSVALTRTLVNKFRTPEQLMSDGQFLKDYVLCSKEVKDAVIAEYLQGIRAGEVPFVLSSGGMQCVTNPKRPKSIEEAGFMFLKDNE